MGFAIYSDPLLRLALYCGIGAILAALLMIVAILVLRLGLLLRLRREGRFVAVWRPLMAQCVDSTPDPVPSLAAADRDAFLRLWNHYHESLLGAAKENLNRLASAAGIEPVAREMLAHRSLRQRLMAVVTLGHLGDKTVWHDLRALAEDESPVLSLAAARAMLRIEPAPVLEWFIPLAAARQDWPLARVAAMLEEAGVDRVTPALAAALDSALGEDPDAAGMADRLSRLLQLSGVAHAVEVEPRVCRILEERGEAGVLADALSALRDPRNVGQVRRYAQHDSWVVRVAAAKALGRVGMPEDRKLLTDMLGDPNWWVRYRSAHSLAGLPFVKIEELRMIRSILPDEFAGQVLDQVIAERS